MTDAGTGIPDCIAGGKCAAIMKIPMQKIKFFLQKNNRANGEENYQTASAGHKTEFSSFISWENASADLKTRGPDIIWEKNAKS